MKFSNPNIPDSYFIAMDKSMRRPFDLWELQTFQFRSHLIQPYQPTLLPNSRPDRRPSRDSRDNLIATPRPCFQYHISKNCSRLNCNKSHKCLHCHKQHPTVTDSTCSTAVIANRDTHPLFRNWLQHPEEYTRQK